MVDERVMVPESVMASLNTLKALQVSDKYKQFKEKAVYTLQTLEYGQNRELVTIASTEGALLDEAKDELYAGLPWTYLIKKLIGDVHDLISLKNSENKVLIDFVKDVIGEKEEEEESE